MTTTPARGFYRGLFMKMGSDNPQMPNPTRAPLTDATVRAAAPREKTWKLADSHGLFVLVKASGSKWWRLKYRFEGKEKSLSFGEFPGVGVREARKRRDEARKLLAAGIDPGEIRKDERTAQRGERDRQKAATRFVLDSDGALSFRPGTRHLFLTAAETAELRAFLDATRGVKPKV